MDTVHGQQRGHQVRGPLDPDHIGGGQQRGRGAHVRPVAGRAAAHARRQVRGRDVPAALRLQTRRIIRYSVTTRQNVGRSNTCTLDAIRPGAPARSPPHPPQAGGSSLWVRSGVATRCSRSRGGPSARPGLASAPGSAADSLRRSAAGLAVLPLARPLVCLGFRRRARVVLARAAGNCSPNPGPTWRRNATTSTSNDATRDCSDSITAACSHHQSGQLVIRRLPRHPRTQT